MIDYYNIAFERSVLSSFLFDSQIFENHRELLVPDDFYLPAFQNVFNAMCLLNDEQKPIDEEFIKKILVSNNSFDESAMLDIMMANPISNIVEYINEVKELSHQRKLVSLSLSIKDDISVDDKVELLKKSIDSIENGLSSVEETDCNNLLDMHFNNKVTYDTGISSINHIIGGLERGQLIYITGAEEAGKTHLSYKIMENLSDGFKVGIISLEFGKRKLKERLQRMIKRGHKLNPKNIKASFESHSINKIEKLIRKWASEGVGFIVLDSFNLVENFKSSDNNHNVIDTGRRLFKLTQQLDILLLCISTSTKADHKEGNPSIYGGQLLNHYCDQKWHILRDLETEERLLWVNKNKQNYQYGKQKLVFNRDGSIGAYKVEETTFSESNNISMPTIA